MVISRFVDIHWPSRSPDLPPPDYFLCGYLKEKVCVTRPRTIDELKEDIRRVIETISTELLRQVMDSITIGAQECLVKVATI